MVLLGGVACTAEAQTGSPSPAATTPIPTASRQPIGVELNPAKTEGGATKSIRIRAFCPLPQGGTEHRATARSKAFTGVVTLTPPAAATPSGSATPAATANLPEVRGFALLAAGAKAGTYTVEVRCDTNDSGTATLIIAAAPSSSPEPAKTPTKTRIPTRAPHAGGGGTAAGGPQDDSGLPLPLTGLAVVLAVGAGAAVVRRRRG